MCLFVRPGHDPGHVSRRVQGQAPIDNSVPASLRSCHMKYIQAPINSLVSLRRVLALSSIFD